MPEFPHIHTFDAVSLRSYIDPICVVALFCHTRCAYLCAREPVLRPTRISEYTRAKSANTDKRASERIVYYTSACRSACALPHRAYEFFSTRSFVRSFVYSLFSVIDIETKKVRRNVSADVILCMLMFAISVQYDSVRRWSQTAVVFLLSLSIYLFNKQKRTENRTNGRYFFFLLLRGTDK